MSWFEGLLPKKERATIRHDRKDVFVGSWGDAQKSHAELCDGIQKLFNFAINVPRDGGTRLMQPGEKVVFQLNQAELGEVGKGTIADGDFEIEVRRVR